MKILNLDTPTKKRGFLPNDIRLKKLPQLENSRQDDNKMRLVHIARYICQKNERIDDTFYYRTYGCILKTNDPEGLAGDTVWQQKFYSSIFFHKVGNDNSGTSSCNLLMMISE